MSARARSFFILAGDLSGAADCAVSAARSGLSSVVLFTPDQAEAAQVLAVDSDSRYRAPAEAQAINTALWRAHASPERLFYKKIDSTLRGNVAAEIAALTAAGLAIIAPAFPAAGRTMRQGRVFVHGVPLEDTEIGAHESLRGGANLPAMLQAHGVRTATVSLDTIRSELRAELRRQIDSGHVQALVCDAEEDDDLSLIAQASVGLPVYWVGSAGLAAHLPRAAGLVGAETTPQPTVRGAILTVVASLSTHSRQQADVLAAQTASEVFTLPVDSLRGGESHCGWRAFRDEAARSLRAGRDVLLRTDVGEGHDLAVDHGVCAALARLIEPSARYVGALVATGGETARALLSHAFGAHALRIVREIEPGVPLSISLGRTRIPVITKAGAFGASSTLLNCHTELATLRRTTLHAS